MLTWETLTDRFRNENIDDDTRLIAQLLIELRIFYLEVASEYEISPKIDIEALFKNARQNALLNSNTHYQQIIK